MPSWNEQYERMKRRRTRLSEHMHGRTREEQNERVLDDFHAFFESCFHLRDWIINDDGIAIPEQEVRRLVNNSEWLGLCADIANGSKHAVLRYARRDPDTHVRGETFSQRLGPLMFEASVFEVTTSTQEYDAFKVADECIGEWDNFLKEKKVLT